MKHTAFHLGRFGEDLVARFMGFKRVPASGARWPNKEDLIREDGTGSDLAQVKTTRSRMAIQGFKDLMRHASVVDADPHWYEVIVSADEVLIFERVLRHRLRRGIGGEVEA